MLLFCYGKMLNFAHSRLVFVFTEYCKVCAKVGNTLEKKKRKGEGRGGGKGGGGYEMGGGHWWGKDGLGGF
jgi:hypothetical protein